MIDEAAPVLSPLSRGEPRHRRAGPGRDPHRRRTAARGDPGPGAGGRGLRLTPAAHLPGRVRAHPGLDDCCARTRPRRAWSPVAPLAGSAVRRARPGSWAPTQPRWWPRSPREVAGPSLLARVDAVAAAPARARVCTATPRCSSSRARGSACAGPTRRRQGPTAPGASRHVLAGDHAPAVARGARRAGAWHAGDGRHARDHVRAGLADLHAWQSSFGSLDLQSTLVGHGRDLARRGSSSRSTTARPATSSSSGPSAPAPWSAGSPRCAHRPTSRWPTTWPSCGCCRASSPVRAPPRRDGSRSCARGCASGGGTPREPGEVTEPADLDQLRAGAQGGRRRPRGPPRRGRPGRRAGLYAGPFDGGRPRAARPAA